jgi:hypothetical protein
MSQNRRLHFGSKVTALTVDRFVSISAKSSGNLKLFSTCAMRAEFFDFFQWANARGQEDISGRMIMFSVFGSDLRD